MSKKNDKTLKKALDLVDAGNFGSAEAQLTTLPSDWDEAQAVRSVLLVRKGKRGEATAIAEGLVERDFILKGASGNAIDSLVHVLQQVSSHTALIKAYTQVLSLMDPAMPSSTPIQTNLFNAMIMGKDYAGAQRLGIALFKKTKDDAFLVRSIMCNLCQLRDVTDPEAMLVKLTTKQLEGQIAKPAATPEIAGMYVTILKKVDVMKAVEWICGEEGSKVGLPSMRLQMLFDVASSVDGGLPVLRNIVARHAWASDSDNWNYFMQYSSTLANSSPAAVEVSFPLTSILGLKSKQSSPTVADTLADALALCKALQAVELKRSESAKMKRGPFLAELVLAKATASFPHMVKEYIRLFGRKSTCFLDIAMLADGLDAIAVDEIVALCEGSMSQDPVAGRQYALLSKKLHLLKWASGEGVPDAETLMAGLVEGHRSRAADFKSLEWSEEGPMDGLLIVAANIAVRQAICAKCPIEEQSWLLRGLQCFAGMDRRKNNPGVLILAILLSQRLGLGFPHDFAQLDFKSIQFVTMGHVGFWPLAASRLVTSVRTYGENANRYFSNLHRETDALKWKVFDHCTWSKAAEIDGFEAKLSRSLPRRELGILHVLLEIKNCQTQKYTIEHVRAAFSSSLASFENLASVDEVAHATTVAEDEKFLTAFLVDRPNSESSRQSADYLFRAHSKDARCAVVALCASAYAALYDIAGLELARTQPKKGIATDHSLLKVWGVTASTVADAGRRCAGVLGLVDWSPVVASSVEIVVAMRSTPSGVGAVAEGLVGHLLAIKASLETTTPVDAAWALVFPFGWFLTSFINLLPVSACHPIAAVLNDTLVAAVTRFEAQIAQVDRAEKLSDLLQVMSISGAPLESLPTTELADEIKKAFAPNAKALLLELKELSAEVSSALRRKK